MLGKVGGPDGSSGVVSDSVGLVDDDLLILGLLDLSRELTLLLSGSGLLGEVGGLGGSNSLLGVLVSLPGAGLVGGLTSELSGEGDGGSSGSKSNELHLFVF